jgi:3-hydroxybutyryl-CoA dehydratase
LGIKVNYKFNELKIGMKVSSKRVITDKEIQEFAKLSKDMNPIHLNEEYAANSFFTKRIAHGMFVSSFISALIGQDLPGEGSIYLSQSLKFLKPVFIGDEIITEVEVINLVPEKDNVELSTICKNQEDKIVIEGKALIKMISK